MSEERNMQEIKKERERERKDKRHLRQLEFNDNGDLSRDFLEGILDTSELQEQTLVKLQEYLHRTWFLANMTDAEAHDQKYKLEVMKYKIFGMHPPKESVIQGPLRAFLFDDEAEELRFLKPAEKTEISALFDTLKHAVVTRGRGGFERKALHTEVRESRTKSESFEEDDSSGRLGGLFG